MFESNQSPLFFSICLTSDSDNSLINCGSRDLVRIYEPKVTTSSSSDQQVLTWIAVKTFCFNSKSIFTNATREEKIALSSIIIKPKTLSSSSQPVTGDQQHQQQQQQFKLPSSSVDVSNVKVMVEVISHFNETSNSLTNQEKQSTKPSATIKSNSVSGTILAATWIEITTQANCPTYCPEVGGCISPDLWCDGFLHCPSGLDEANCDHLQMQTIITSENEPTLLSSTVSGGKDSTNIGVGIKSSVSNSSQFTSTSILTLVLSLIVSLILIASVIAVATYVIKSSDLRRRIRRAKAALDSSRNSSASGSSSAVSFGSSHYSFNFPRITPGNRGGVREVKSNIGITSTLGNRIGGGGGGNSAVRHPIIHSTTSRSNGHGSSLLALEATSGASHRLTSKDLSIPSPLVISSVNTSIDTTGTSSNNSSCSSNGGHGTNVPQQHTYHRATGPLFRSTGGNTFYSTSTVAGPSGPTSIVPPQPSLGPFSLAQNNSHVVDGEGFLPSEKEFDYRSFIVTPSFTSSSRTSSRTSSKSVSNGHGYSHSKSKVKNMSRKQKGEQASQLELLIQQSTSGPLVPSGGTSSTFRSSRIMTLGHPDRQRHQQLSPPNLPPILPPRVVESKNDSSLNGPYAAFNLYEDICDIGVIHSPNDERNDRQVNQINPVNHQLVNHYTYNNCNENHNLDDENGPIDEETGDSRDDESNIISVNESMLEGSLGVNLHQAKTSSHYIGRRNVF